VAEARNQGHRSGGVRSNENFLRNKKNNLEYILCVSVAKRGDLETPTKSALLFFVRGKKRKTFLYFFLLGEKRVFTTPLTRNTLSTNITTNITNVEFPLAGTKAKLFAWDRRSFVNSFKILILYWSRFTKLEKADGS
jgi:hypothetical protein